MEIKEALSLPFEIREIHPKAAPDPLSDFKEMLSRSIHEVNQLSNEANLKVEEMLRGEADIHEAMIALEKAGISMKLMLQIRNKILTAYEEVMRMQF